MWPRSVPTFVADSLGVVAGSRADKADKQTRRLGRVGGILESEPTGSDQVGSQMPG